MQLLIFQQRATGAYACGHPCVCFMLPDFYSLGKGGCDRTPDQSSKSSTDNRFSAQTTSQRFNKEATPEHPTSRFCDTDHRFFQLWLTQPSWSPIIKKPDGWLTIPQTESGKKVPLVLGTIKSYYRRDIPIGKRHSHLTDYLLIDVDIHSPFHPYNGGIQPILDAMEDIGLCRYVLVRSSDSEGLHIYFPLPMPVRSWHLACTAHAALTAVDVTVAGGVCELFPNKKNYGAEYNGHRLPLQQGSYLLDESFRCIGNSREAFLVQWAHCCDGQDMALLAQKLKEKHKPQYTPPQPVSVTDLPPIAWTKTGESNEVMKQLVNYGDRYLGHNTIPKLAEWIIAVAPLLPGFEQFASEESKNDLRRRGWAYRWAKSHFNSARLHKAVTSYDHNAFVAAEALERLKAALRAIVIEGVVGIDRLWKMLSKISSDLFGVGFGWNLIQKYRDFILASVGSSCQVGLSSRRTEGKNLSKEEQVSSEISGAEDPAKEAPPRLITARSVGVAQGNEQKAPCPPSEAPKAVAETGVKQGERRSKVSAALSEVIQATSQQLLAVLGKASPFSGAGLWTIRRSELSKQQWQLLAALVLNE